MLMLCEMTNYTWGIKTVAIKTSIGEFVVRVYSLSFGQCFETKSLSCNSEAEAMKMARMIAFGE